MASTYGIDGPEPLFVLPKSLDSTKGQTLSGSSWGVTGSRKRKRVEIVIGVDGECINLYNVKSRALVISHAIPLQAYLTAPPLSVKCKALNGACKRFTYASLRNELGHHKYQIYCFREDLPTGKGQVRTSFPSPIKSTRDIGSHEDNVVLLEAVATSHAREHAAIHDLLVVQESGRISGLSADLSDEVWKMTFQELLENDRGNTAEAGKRRRVLHGFCLSAFDAKKGILNGRGDLIASISPSDNVNDEALEQSTLLCLITQPVEANATQEAQCEVNVLVFQPRLQGLSRPPLRLLVRWVLPRANTSSSFAQSKIQFGYAKSAGTMHQVVGGSAITYTFSTLGPKISSQVQIPEEPILSFVPLQQDLAVASTHSRYYLLNLRYQSIQASVPVTAAYTTQLASRKRQRLDNSDADPAQLIESFSSEALVVGININTIVGFSISLPVSVAKGAKASRLIDSLARGIKSPSSKARTAPELATLVTVSNLAASDPSLAKVSQHLIDRQPIALSGAVEAIKHLLRSFNTPHPAPAAQTHLLTNGITPTSNGTATPEESADAALALEDAALTADLARAESLLIPASLHARGQALKIAISLLGTTFPGHDVARAMRDQLERSDIMFLIELLRIELEQGGWTSHILDIWPGDDDADAEDPGSERQDAIIAVLARLLTRSIDALGMGAWLTTAGQDSDNSDDEDAMSIDGAITPSATRTQDTLSALHAQTTAVLECSQEATWFANFLFEFLRYEQAIKRSSKSSTSVTGTSKKSGIITEKERNRVVAPGITVAEAPLSGTMALVSVLPLGVRTAKGVDGLVVGSGGQVKNKSKRAIGHELNKRVGVYSFEQVRV